MKHEQSIRSSFLIAMIGALCLGATTGLAESDGNDSPVAIQLFGDRLMNSARETVATEELEGKKIALFFTAGWCPPCRQFTPMLIEAYNAWRSDDVPIEVVLVSWDRSVVDMIRYMRQSRMPWLAMPFSPRQQEVLNRRFRVDEIPTLVVIDAEGNTLTTTGVMDVVRHGREAIARW